MSDEGGLRVAAVSDELDRLLAEQTANFGDSGVHAACQSALAIKDYLTRHPQERTAAFDRLSVVAPITFPWDIVRGPTRGLAFLYNFAPFQDTGSTVASKRLREFGETVDVIACSMLYHKKVDLTVETIARPYLGRREFVQMPPSWAGWDAFQGFAVRANLIADEWIREGADYEFVYSRAMWAPSIYAGALFKKRHPEVHWIAEFSDPMSLDVQGKPRGGEIPRAGLFEDLIRDVQTLESFYEREEPTIFSFAERLAYALADEIIFTNGHQRQVMLDALGEGVLRERASKIGRVSNHPTLPAPFYSATTVPTYAEPQFLNIAYFGEFYASRGITEIMDAVAELSPDLADQVRLHVFTNYAPGLKSAGTANFSAARQKELEGLALAGVGVEAGDPRVVFHQSLSYLDFLAAMDQFDVLVVSDAESGSGHAVNPYLPSKWSDYSGSATPVWALVEPGSVLSTKPAAHKTLRGSVPEAATLLEELLAKQLRGQRDD